MTLSRRARLGAAALSAVAATALSVTITGGSTSTGSTGTTAISRGGPAVPPVAVVPGATAAVLTPEMFGAAGDGEQDDTRALQEALAALRSGDSLTLGEGRTYRHHDVLELATPRTTLTGPGVLLAADEERSSLFVRADGVEVRGVVLRITGTTRRWTGLTQHRLVVQASADVRVRDVRIEGSAGAGVYVEASSRFRLERLVVVDTRADGIHMTGGSTDGVVVSPLVQRSGDDGVAVVSYDADRGPSARISVLSPRVEGTTWGRGVSVVGGEDVTYRDVHVQDSSAAGVYIATEGEPFNTRPVARVQVLGAEVLRANHTSTVDHGAVLIASGSVERPVYDVVVERLRITGTRGGASRQVGVLGEEGSVKAVALRSFVVEGGGDVFQSTAGLSAYRADGWIVDGTALADAGGA